MFWRNGRPRGFPPAARYGLVLGLGLLIRLALVPLTGYGADVQTFSRWSAALVQFGPHAFYSDVSGKHFEVVDYPVGYAYVLWATGEFYFRMLGQSDVGSRLLHFLIKLPAMLADFGLAALARLLVLRIANERAAFGVFAALLLAPPLWLISADWGQVDSVPMLAFTGALLAMAARRFDLGWALVALTIMIKPQSLATVPVLLVWDVRTRGFGLGLLRAPLYAFAIAYVLSLPFSPTLNPLGVPVWIVKRLLLAVSLRKLGSTGAFNLYGVFQLFGSPDSLSFLGISISTWGFLLVFSAVAVVAAALWIRLGTPDVDQKHRTAAAVFGAFLAFASLFMFATRMHERYLLPALVAGAVTVAAYRRVVWPEIILATTFTLNCTFVLLGFTTGLHHPITRPIAHILSAINVLTTLFLIAIFVRDAISAKARRADTLPATS